MSSSTHVESYLQESDYYPLEEKIDIQYGR